MGRHGRIAIGVSVAAVALPGVALAGKTVVSGQQTLQIKAHLTPARAGAHHVALGFRFDYRSTTPGQQPPYNAKTITLLMPKGLAFKPAAAPACRRSQIDAAHGDVGQCPADTIVGHGSVVVNAAPTISAPVSGTVTEYNAINDTGESQEPKGTRNLILWVKTSLGVDQGIPFRVLKVRGGRTELQARFTKPAQPGVAPGTYTIQTVKLSTARSLITNPTSCPGSWPFTLTVTNYFSQPSITAHDRVKCRA